MFFRYNVWGILWAGIIFVLSLMPGKDLPKVSFWDFLAFDKIAHFGVYAILVWLLIFGFSKQYNFKYLRYNSSILAIGIAILYGGLLELMQHWMWVDRYADVLDFTANCLGSVGGWVVFSYVRPKK